MDPRRTLRAPLLLAALCAPSGVATAAANPRLELEVLLQPTRIDGLVVLESRVVWPDDAQDQTYSARSGLSYQLDLKVLAEPREAVWSDDPGSSCIGPTSLFTWPGAEIRRIHVLQLPPGLSATQRGDEPPALAVRVRTLSNPARAGEAGVPPLSSGWSSLDAQFGGPPADSQIAASLALDGKRRLAEQPAGLSGIPERLEAALATELSPSVRAFVRLRLGQLAADESFHGEAIRWLESIELPRPSTLSLQADGVRATSLLALGRLEDARVLVTESLRSHAALTSSCERQPRSDPRRSNTWGVSSQPPCSTWWRLRGVALKLDCEVASRCISRLVATLAPEERQLYDHPVLDLERAQRVSWQDLSAACWEGESAPEMEEWVKLEAERELKKWLSDERSARALGFTTPSDPSARVLSELHLDPQRISDDGRRLLASRAPSSISVARLSPGERVTLYWTQGGARRHLAGLHGRPETHVIPDGPGELALGHDGQIPSLGGTTGAMEPGPVVTFLRGNVVVTIAAGKQRLAHWLDQQILAQLSSHGIPAMSLDATPRVLAQKFAPADPTEAESFPKRHR